MHRVILHLDMDAFYASVEQRDRPELKGLPVIVGAPSNQRGVVCAASYEARKFGVRSAMPSITAGRLCPDGIFIRPRIDAYRAESRAVMQIVRDFAGDLVQQVSVDEAYIDISLKCSGSTHDSALQSAVPLGHAIKSAIQTQRNLTATAGIASNKLLAKLASDFRKPDGLTLILESQKVEFLAPLAVRSLHGVGRVTEDALAHAGIKTVGDLQRHQGDLRALVGSWGRELQQYAFGIDERPLDFDETAKSISSENTFLKDTADRPTLRACLREQADEIASKLQKHRLAGLTVQVKVRYSNFTTLTRQTTVEEPFSDPNTIYRLGCWLLARDKLVKSPLRLIGLSVSTLVEPRFEQLHLPFQADQKR